MNELRSILNAWRQNGPHHDQAVLATVVHVTGSAYRRPGARMLILPDGRRFGTISGGCLEGDVVRKASWWTSDQGTALRVFDNSSEDAAWEFGLGCNGVITVLLERLALAQVTEMLAFLDQRQASRRSAVVATVIRSSDTSRAAPGDRLDRAFHSHGLTVEGFRVRDERGDRRGLGQRDARPELLGLCSATGRSEREDDRQ